MVKYVVLEGFAVIADPEHLTPYNLADLVAHIESQFWPDLPVRGRIRCEGPGQRAARSLGVREALATVWSRTSTVADGEVILGDISLYTMIEHDDGWKIAGFAETQWDASSFTPPLVKEATPE